MNFSLLKLPTVNKVIMVLIFHTIVTVLAYLTKHHFDASYPIPGSENLVQFDASFYDSISLTGYEYVPGVGNNLAFFPLFPLFWKYSGLGPMMISLVNYLIFSTSFVLLLNTEKLRFTTLLILLTIPSFIFFAVPYSEALFFLFCTAIVIGYKKQSNYLLYLGLFGASMVRSVCLVFIPAIIICELLNLNNRATVTERVISSCYKLLATVAGLFSAMIYVEQETGTWFYFIEIQKYWHREWLMIKVPLTTIGAERVLGIDGITFIVGVLAIGITCTEFIKFIINTVREKYRYTLKIDQGVIFSALYIAGMTLLDTFFTTYYQEQTNIWSINRHVLATPFSITFLIFLLRDYLPGNYTKSLICIFLILSIYITGVFKYPNMQVLTLFISFICMFLLLKYTTVAKRLYILYYILAVYLQITFFKDFITGGWVG